MTKMMDVENIWIVVAVDPDEVNQKIADAVRSQSIGEFRIHLLGMRERNKENVIMRAAVCRPDLQVLDAWLLSDLLTG